MKNKAKLYLICPDCQIENIIRSKFEKDSYFLTALGAVFNMSEFKYAEEVNHYINKLDISEIVIVTDVDCTFKKAVVCQDETFDTRAERELTKLRVNNNSLFEDLGVEEEKKMLAKLNIYQQTLNLLNIAFIGNKIRENKIKISGLIYHRKKRLFEKKSYADIHSMV
jgi:carbonic anhydrase